MRAAREVEGGVLKQALQEYGDRRAKASLPWLERDKLSQRLLAFPGGDTTMDSEVFAEEAASILCLPNRACADRIGFRI